jgi:preprotein translocase subunit YajC
MIFGALSAAMMPAQPGQTGSNYMPLIMMAMVFAIFYFLLIMPQRKKQKKHLEMINELKPGDRIITTAGIFGTVMGVQKNLIELRIASSTNIKITKSAVGVIRGVDDRLESE